MQLKLMQTEINEYMKISYIKIEQQNRVINV